MALQVSLTLITFHELIFIVFGFFYIYREHPSLTVFCRNVGATGFEMPFLFTLVADRLFELAFAVVPITAVTASVHRRMLKCQLALRLL